MLAEVYQGIQLLPEMRRFNREFRAILAAENDPVRLPPLSSEATAYLHDRGLTTAKSIAEQFFYMETWSDGLIKLGEGYRRAKDNHREQFHYRLRFEGSIWFDERGAVRLGLDVLTDGIYNLSFDRPEDLWRLFGKCKKCGVPFWINRAGKDYCSLRCGNAVRRQRARRVQNPNDRRPPTQVEEVKSAIAVYCDENDIKTFRKSPKSVQWLREYTELRPTTIEKCIAHLQSQRKGKG